MASGKLKMLRMDDGHIGTAVLIADMGPNLIAGETFWIHGLLYDPDANEFFVWGKARIYKILPRDWSVSLAANNGNHPTFYSGAASQNFMHAATYVGSNRFAITQGDR
jgi:hypothetical protein